MNRNSIIAAAALVVVFTGLMSLWVVYSCFRIDVPSKHIAILTKKTGIDIANNMEVAPDAKHKGIQQDILTEGRYFYNPYKWDWDVQPMIEVPTGQLGVRVRLIGENLPYGDIIAWEEAQKGIVPEVLRPGRYAINRYVEQVEFHEPVTVPAGYKGVVTLLAAPMPEDPNQLLVTAGTRGVQEETLEPGTYYVNPYVTRVNLIDCRSQRFNLGATGDFGFPSKDGFWVHLDGILEFRVRPEMAADVFVTYNDINNDQNGERVDEEVINKIILPNARSFCRLRGSNNAGRDFIGGETRIAFQKDFQTEMVAACEPLGVEIVQALITKISPPDAIAGPIRDREVAEQRLGQYEQQILQQESEKNLAIEQALVEQKQELVGAEQKVVVMTVKAKEEQQVAVTKANEKLGVAGFKLEAAKDEALAVLARGKADADVIEFNNEAEAAGWKRAVAAFSGDGNKYATYVLYQKLAPGFRRIMANTGDSPLMQIFEDFRKNGNPNPTPVPAVGGNSAN